MTASEEHAPAFFITAEDVSSLVRTSVRLSDAVTASFFAKKSADAFETGGKSEDTIAWLVSPSREIISFAVCDGVSGSYLGYFASRYLAEGLVEGLNTWVQSAPEGETITPEELAAELNSWQADAQEKLEQQPLSTDISPLLAEVMRNRRLGGSHTVFFCGFLDLRPGRQSFFAWMGNVRGQVYDSLGNALLDTGTMADDRERWTTSQGCLGTPQVAWLPSSEISRVLVASDGLEDHFADFSATGSQSSELDYIERLTGLAYKDDASLLSLWVSPETTRSAVLAGDVTETPLVAAEVEGRSRDDNSDIGDELGRSVANEGALEVQELPLPLTADAKSEFAPEPVMSAYTGRVADTAEPTSDVQVPLWTQATRPRPWITIGTGAALLVGVLVLFFIFANPGLQGNVVGDSTPTATGSSSRTQSPAPTLERPGAVVSPSAMLTASAVITPQDTATGILPTASVTGTPTQTPSPTTSVTVPPTASPGAPATTTP